MTAAAEKNEKVTLEDLAVLREVQRRLEDVRGLKSAPREPVRALGWRLARMLSATAAPGGTKLALDQGLAATLQATYGTDAAETDAAFFTGTPLADALAGLGDKAVDVPQSVELKELVSAETYRLSLGWIQLIHDLYILKPADWRPYFQANPLRAETLPQPGDFGLFPELEQDLDTLERALEEDADADDD